MAYATFADVQGYLPQFPINTTTKPTQAQVEGIGLPDSEAEFTGRVTAIEFKLDVTFPITGAAFIAWAKMVVSLMAAAWALEARAAAVGGDAALQTAKYYRERANYQFELLEEGKLAFEDAEGEVEEPELASGDVRGGPGDEPRATMGQIF